MKDPSCKVAHQTQMHTRRDTHKFYNKRIFLTNQSHSFTHFVGNNAKHHTNFLFEVREQTLPQTYAGFYLQEVEKKCSLDDVIFFRKIFICGFLFIDCNVNILLLNDFRHDSSHFKTFSNGSRLVQYRCRITRRGDWIKLKKKFYSPSRLVEIDFDEVRYIDIWLLIEAL